MQALPVDAGAFDDLATAEVGHLYLSSFAHQLSPGEEAAVIGSHSDGTLGTAARTECPQVQLGSSSTPTLNSKKG